MSDQSKQSRREFVATVGAAAGASAFAGLTVPPVHAGEDNTIRVALVGCGGRGTGAAANAMSVKNGPVKLVAMADVFEDRLDGSYKNLEQRYSDRMDVPPERRFIGFDAYKKAMDCLRPGDVAIFATPPAFRWVHFKYAIEKGLNVFMEKPIGVDGPTSLRMIELGKEAEKRNLKVAVGLMCRHCRVRMALAEKVHNGEIGDIIFARAYRVVGPTGSAFVKKNTTGKSDLEYQIRHFHAFLWLSGGAFSDFLIHNLDEACWMKNAWPIEAKGFGGRHYRGDYVDQNFDTYVTEYTFPDGTKFVLYGRCMPGCYNEFATWVHGTKSLARVSTSAHYPARSRIYDGHIASEDHVVWRWEGGRREPNPYQTEWDDLIDAIRNDKPYSEVYRGAMASLMCAVGRYACHTGQKITVDDYLKLGYEFAPNVDKMDYDTPPPVQPDEEGRYPVPMPGIVTDREYLPQGKSLT